MRWWRLRGGELLVQWPDSYLPGYLRIAGSELVEEYPARAADDCELLYIWGHRVDADRFERVRVCEVGPPAPRRTVDVLGVVYGGLVELPAGALTEADLGAAQVAVGHAVERLRSAFCDQDSPVAFVPRLLEPLVTGASPAGDVEAVFGEIRESGWDTWPSYRRAAVLALLDAYWTALLVRHPAPYAIGDVLCGLGRLVDDVRTHLDRWSALASDAAALHLHDFVRDNIEPATNRGRLADPNWNGRAGTERLVVGWLRSRGLAEAVEGAVSEGRSPPARDALHEVGRRLARAGAGP